MHISTPMHFRQEGPLPLSPAAARRRENSSAVNAFTRRHTTPDMTASSTYGMVLCGSDEEHRYRGRIEKVKFGVPINEAFSRDIPATLLILLLKVNKEGPLKKDIWRAPGNQAQVRKLTNIMQHGRLLNISNISVYTAASVIKRFLAKLPGGILGVESEKQLFEAIQQKIEDEQQRELFCRIVSSLPVPSQHLLALLFGTFRVIADSAETFGSRMTPDAIGISVAPSLFHTCIHDGLRAKLEDIIRYKLASQMISKIIHWFGFTNLFPRHCYEFYARITGRTLRVDEQWHFSFQLPSRSRSQPSVRRNGSQCSPLENVDEKRIAELEKRQLQNGGAYGEERTGGGGSGQQNCPLGHQQQQKQQYTRRFRQREHQSAEESRRRRMGGDGHSWEGQQTLENMAGRPTASRSLADEVPMQDGQQQQRRGQSHRLLDGGQSMPEDGGGLLEWVHERQTERMRSRSEWFLSTPGATTKQLPAERRRPCRSFALPRQQNGMTKTFAKEQEEREWSKRRGEEEEEEDLSSKSQAKSLPVTSLERAKARMVEFADQRAHNGAWGSDDDLCSSTTLVSESSTVAEEEEDDDAQMMMGSGESLTMARDELFFRSLSKEERVLGRQRQREAIIVAVTRNRSWRTHYTRPTRGHIGSGGKKGNWRSMEATDIVEQEVLLTDKRRHNSSDDATTVYHHLGLLKTVTTAASATGASGRGAATIIRRKSSGNSGPVTGRRVQVQRQAQIC